MRRLGGLSYALFCFGFLEGEQAKGKRKGGRKRRRWDVWE